MPVPRPPLYSAKRGTGCVGLYCALFRERPQGRGGHRHHLIIAPPWNKTLTTYLGDGVGAKKPAARAGRSTSKLVRRPSMVLSLCVGVVGVGGRCEKQGKWSKNGESSSSSSSGTQQARTELQTQNTQKESNALTKSRQPRIESD